MLKKIYSIIAVLLASIALYACTPETTELLPPQNIRLEDNKILFESAHGANHYELELNGDMIKIINNEYRLDAYGEYNIRIRSVNSSTKSLFSDYLVIKYEEHKNDENKQDDSVPYIKNGNQKTYLESNNLIIEFHLPEGFYIKSISAPNNDISNDEFVIGGSVVELKDSFLKRKFEENRQSLILAFVVSNNEKQFILNIFINK